jgi:hypothetical protein
MRTMELPRRPVPPSALIRQQFTPDSISDVRRQAGDAVGATAEEQSNAPVRTTIGAVRLGAAEDGAHAHIDRIAHEADGIIVIGGVKTHPESAGELASGPSWAVPCLFSHSLGRYR